jgi:hypothetical protein
LVRDWDWEDHLKEVVKEALIEFADESQQEGMMDITTLNLPCKYCSLPVKAGQIFLVYHSECHEKEQALR